MLKCFASSHQLCHKTRHGDLLLTSNNCESVLRVHMMCFFSDLQVIMGMCVCVCSL